MRKFSLLVCIQISLLASCDATDPVTSVAAAKPLNDGAHSRVVSVYLEPQPGSSYIPAFDGRIIVAEPVYTVPVVMARGSATVDGVDVVYVGEDCQVLQTRYPEIHDCIEEETAQFKYGEVESTVIANSEGFASMTLADAEKYRVRVQSFVTREDAKCFWGGEETVGVSDTDVSIPVLVFCE